MVSLGANINCCFSRDDPRPVLYYLLKKAWGREQILEGLKKITDGELQYKIPTEKLSGEQAIMADYINHIGECFP